MKLNVECVVVRRDYVDKDWKNISEYLSSYNNTLQKYILNYVYNYIYKKIYITIYKTIYKYIYIYIWGFHGGLVGKESACNAGDLGGVGKIPWKRKWQTNPVFLPWKSSG